MLASKEGVAEKFELLTIVTVELTIFKAWISLSSTVKINKNISLLFPSFQLKKENFQNYIVVASGF